MIFKREMEKRKYEMVSDFGELKKITSTGLVKADEDKMRLAVSMPSKLHNALHTVLLADTEPFLESDEELHWFMREYPMFTFPNKI